MERVGKIVRGSLLAGVKEGIQNNSTVFLLTYSALSASQMDSLRKNLRRTGAKMLVPQNRIAKLALKELKQDKLAEGIKGQAAFVWTSLDAVAVSKALLKYTKDLQGIVIKGGILDGEYLQNDDIKRLSDLPSKEVLQAKLLGLLSSPVSRLLSALNAKSRDLLSILKQYSEKKGGN